MRQPDVQLYYQTTDWPQSIPYAPTAQTGVEIRFHVRFPSAHAAAGTGVAPPVQAIQAAPAQQAVLAPRRRRRRRRTAADHQPGAGVRAGCSVFVGAHTKRVEPAAASAARPVNNAGGWSDEFTTERAYRRVRRRLRCGESAGEKGSLSLEIDDGC